MHLKEEQIIRLATRIITDLSTAEMITLRAERGAVLEGIKKAISIDMKNEESLERDAEKLLEETLRGTKGALDIDRHKMLRMIKDRLAKERKIVL